VGAVATGQLLTNGPGVRWLRKVLGHLPVDVKPAEKKQTRVRWAQSVGLEAAGRVLTTCLLGQQATVLPQTNSSCSSSPPLMKKS
jgi:hypothetical protein